MLSNFRPLNDLEISFSKSSTTRNSHPFSPVALAKNRTLAPKKGYGQLKKLPMHTIAALEKELSIPE